LGATTMGLRMFVRELQIKYSIKSTSIDYLVALLNLKLDLANIIDCFTIILR
jgi:hypothetical protein